MQSGNRAKNIHKFSKAFIFDENDYALLVQVIGGLGTYLSRLAGDHLDKCTGGHQDGIFWSLLGV